MLRAVDESDIPLATHSGAKSETRIFAEETLGQLMEMDAGAVAEVEEFPKKGKNPVASICAALRYEAYKLGIEHSVKVMQRKQRVFVKRLK